MIACVCLNEVLELSIFFHCVQSIRNILLQLSSSKIRQTLNTGYLFKKIILLVIFAPQKYTKPLMAGWLASWLDLWHANPNWTISCQIQFNKNCF